MRNNRECIRGSYDNGKSYIIGGGLMPKAKIDIVKSNDKTLIVEMMIGSDYRISIPTQARRNIDTKAKYRVTYEKL